MIQTNKKHRRDLNTTRITHIQTHLCKLMLTNFGGNDDGTKLQTKSNRHPLTAKNVYIENIPPQRQYFLFHHWQYPELMNALHHLATIWNHWEFNWRVWNPTTTSTHPHPIQWLGCTQKCWFKMPMPRYVVRGILSDLDYIGANRKNAKLTKFVQTTM